MLDKLNNFLSTMFLPDSDVGASQDTLQLSVAVLLIEVMQADAECAFEEQAAIMNILKDRFRLSEAEVTQLSQQAQQASREANDYYRFTTQINHELELPEKIRIVEYLWQVVYADGKVSAHENHIMRKLVDLLHISLGDNAAAKARARTAAGIE